MSDPIISIVTGTYNRIASLIRMVESARDCIPSGAPYEFVIVDGGSIDGTLQWCKLQPDIRLIEHGELRGAIRAFCDGAVAATGKYVVLANDDITFHSGSLMQAVVYLETVPQCGAVAFLDNRPIPGQTLEQQATYKAQLQPALDEKGNGTQVVYAQVGMFRKWLGDAVGWWGADDPVMGQAKTYGGDNWLSSRIWEAGYTVDIVRDVQCDDHRLADNLRRTNEAHNDRAYAQAYPLGPRLSSKPIEAPAHVERPRVLYMPIYEPGYPQHKLTKRGLRDALAKRCIVQEWDYLNEGIRAGTITNLAPHIILTQFHDPRRGELIDQLRDVAPQAMIINWNGDARALTDPAYIAMLHKVDLQLVVNAAALPVYRQEGIRAAYWQIGYETWPEPVPDVWPHDVVFLGNCYNAQREDLEQALLGTKLDVGLYGHKWQKPAGNTIYDFGVGAALYQRAKIAIGDAFNDGKTPVKAFVSNRIFQALAAGAFFLQQYSDGLDVFTGLRAGEHYLEWRTTEDLIGLIDLYGNEPEERQRIAAAGQRFVLENYSFDVQVKRLFTEILPMLEVEHAAV